MISSLVVAIIIFTYVYMSASVEVEVKLTHTHDPTVPVENVIVVADSRQFAKLDTLILRMPRWRAWQSDPSEPYCVIEDN